jgi:hypothetical protein
MPPIGTQYERTAVKTTSYTITVADDVIKFTAAAPLTATLPQAQTCSLASGQNVKVIASASGSVSDVTIAAASGDTLVGENTLSAGETAYLTSDGVLTWNSIGASGVTGNSGFSGFSGASGYSGFSGYSGYSGASGFSGYSGISAYSGKSGYSGFSAAASGYSGFSAAGSGYSGFSGKSGYSGFSVV